MTGCPKAFGDEGWTLVPSLLAVDEVEDLRRVLPSAEAAPGRGGVRGLMRRFPAVHRLARDGRLRGLAATLLGASVAPVKATLFDKNPGANWKLPFHQDTVVACRNRAEVPGFGPWSVKDGVPHVRAPAAVLARMVALRLHLDETPVTNGALRVVPGSHRHGLLDKREAQALRARAGARACPARPGDVLAMSPLLLHASSASEAPGHRRVIHIEYAAAKLPAPLEWAA